MSSDERFLFFLDYYIYMDITNHLNTYIYIMYNCIIHITYSIMQSIHIYITYIYICIGYHNILKVQTEGVDTLHHIALHYITSHYIRLHCITLHCITLHYIYRCIRIRSYKYITVCIYIYGYGSIPINTIFRGMSIHLPAILMWTTGVQGFDTLPYMYLSIPTCCWWNPPKKVRDFPNAFQVPMEDTKRPIFGAEAERIGTRLDEATDEFLKDHRNGGNCCNGGGPGGSLPSKNGWNMVKNEDFTMKDWICLRDFTMKHGEKPMI